MPNRVSGKSRKPTKPPKYWRDRHPIKAFQAPKPPFYKRLWRALFNAYTLSALLLVVLAAVFFLSGLFARGLGLVKLAGADGNPISLQRAIFRNFFASWASPINASLFYAIAFILLWLLLMWLLYRKRIYIKV